MSLCQSDVAGSTHETAASSVTDLLPGDLLFTGTPDGVGFGRDPQRPLRDGEVLESWIEGIGRLRNRCVAPLPPG